MLPQRFQEGDCLSEHTSLLTYCLFAKVINTDMFFGIILASGNVTSGHTAERKEEEGLNHVQQPEPRRG